MLKKIKKWFGFPVVEDYQKIILEKLEEIEMADKKAPAKKKAPVKKSPAKKAPVKKSTKKK